MNWLPEIVMPIHADPTAADQTVGAWGFVVVLALIVGTLLLWLNMRKQLRKIDVPADHEGDSDAESADEGEQSKQKPAE